MPAIHQIKNNRPHQKTIELNGFNPNIASRAIVDALEYLKYRLEWSGSKIAKILHLPSNTFNTWLKNGEVPVQNGNFSPELQGIIHLLAIHRSLEAIFENPHHQRAWLTTLHPELNVIPENKISESMEGLIYIRQYLDYVRGKGA